MDFSSPPGPELEFSGVPGMLYSIRRSPDLAEWETVASVRAAADGSLRWEDPNPLAFSGFYRIEGP